MCRTRREEIKHSLSESGVDAFSMFSIELKLISSHPGTNHPSTKSHISPEIHRDPARSRSGLSCGDYRVFTSLMPRLPTSTSMPLSVLYSLSMAGCTRTDMKLPNALFSDPLGVNRTLRIHFRYSRSLLLSYFSNSGHRASQHSTLFFRTLWG